MRIQQWPPVAVAKHMGLGGDQHEFPATSAGRFTEAKCQATQVDDASERWEPTMLEFLDQPPPGILHCLQLRSIYLHKLDSSGGLACTRDWLASLYGESLSFAGLIAAIDAMSLGGLEAFYHDEQLRMVARVAYGKAVRNVQRELLRDIARQSLERRLEIFLSIRIIGNCEWLPATANQEATFDIRMNHTRGAATYLQLCGPELINFVTNSAPHHLELFRNLIMQYARLCYRERKACCFGSPDWLKAIRPNDHTGDIYYYRKLDVWCRLTAMLEASDKILDKPLHHWTSIAWSIYEIRKDVEKWFDGQEFRTGEQSLDKKQSPGGQDHNRLWSNGLLNKGTLCDIPRSPKAGDGALRLQDSICSRRTDKCFMALLPDALLLRIITLASYRGIISLGIHHLDQEDLLEDMFSVMRQLCWLIPARLRESPESGFWALELVTHYFKHCGLSKDLQWCESMYGIVDATSNMRDEVDIDAMYRNKTHPWETVVYSAFPAILRAPANVARNTHDQPR